MCPLLWDARHGIGVSSALERHVSALTPGTATNRSQRLGGRAAAGDGAGRGRPGRRATSRAEDNMGLRTSGIDGTEMGVCTG